MKLLERLKREYNITPVKFILNDTVLTESFAVGSLQDFMYFNSSSAFGYFELNMSDKTSRARLITSTITEMENKYGIESKEDKDDFESFVLVNADISSIRITGCTSITLINPVNHVSYTEDEYEIEEDGIAKIVGVVEELAVEYIKICQDIKDGRKSRDSEFTV